VQAFVSSVKSKNHAFVNERVCQFFGIVDVALTQCSEAQRRRLRVSPMGLVRFASNIQLTEDRWSWTNLHEVNESRLSILGKTRDSLASPGGMRVEPLVSKLRSLDRSLHEAEDSARKALYNRICSNNVDADTFCKHVSASLEGIEAVWTYRRTFATQLAVPSILGFILAVGNRAAHTAIFCQYSGRVCAADFHPCISSASSYPEPHLSEMPFRLTRNIERVLQPFLFNGVFKSSLGSISFALQHTLEPGGFLEPYVYLYLGDERTDVSSQNVPAQSHVLKKTIQIIKSRIQSSAPPRDISSSVVHVESGLSKLVEQALSPDNIATMLPQWQPWL
jgi:phosphatidylinositol kinase/protein kinase (PI-3  family)